MSRTPSRLRSLLTLGLYDFAAALGERLLAIEAALKSVAETKDDDRRHEARLAQLERDIAALRTLMVAQDERAQRKLRASLSSTLNLLTVLPQLKIEGVLPPFSHLGWEITGELAAYLFHLVRRHRPKLIFELGSGSSTILLAAAARANGAGRVISVEHDPEHRDRTAQFLRDTELADWVDLIETPLTEQVFAGSMVQWYDLAALLRGMSDRIDLLFIDGPPGRLQPLSRYPALPALSSHLSAQALVLVDDGRREDEARMVELWRDLDLSFDVEQLSFLPRAPFLLRMPASSNRIAELRRAHDSGSPYLEQRS